MHGGLTYMTGNVTSQSAEVVLAVIPIVGIVIGGIIIFFYLFQGIVTPVIKFFEMVSSFYFYYSIL